MFRLLMNSVAYSEICFPRVNSCINAFISISKNSYIYNLFIKSDFIDGQSSMESDFFIT